MDLGLNDRVAVATGAGRGIGRGIAEVLLGEGCRVAIVDRDATGLEACRAELANRFGSGRILAVAADLTDPESVRHLSERIGETWGRLDALAANAAALLPAEPFDNETYRRYMDHNFLIAVNTVNGLLPLLERDGGGAIVITGSIAGKESVGAPPAYAAAKAAIHMYAKTLSDLLAAKAIRVNAIAPGNVYFADGNWARKRAADPDGIDAMIAAKVPLGRFGTPEDIGNAVAFLLSDRAAFITGACVPIDGGQLRS